MEILSSDFLTSIQYDETSSSSFMGRLGEPIRVANLTDSALTYRYQPLTTRNATFFISSRYEDFAEASGSQSHSSSAEFSVYEKDHNTGSTTHHSKIKEKRLEDIIKRANRARLAIPGGLTHTDHKDHKRRVPTPASTVDGHSSSALDSAQYDSSAAFRLGDSAVSKPDDSAHSSYASKPDDSAHSSYASKPEDSEDREVIPEFDTSLVQDDSDFIDKKHKDPARTHHHSSDFHKLDDSEYRSTLLLMAQELAKNKKLEGVASPEWVASLKYTLFRYKANESIQDQLFFPQALHRSDGRRIGNTYLLFTASGVAIISAIYAGGKVSDREERIVSYRLELLRIPAEDLSISSNNKKKEGKKSQSRPSPTSISQDSATPLPIEMIGDKLKPSELDKQMKKLGKTKSKCIIM